MRIGLDLHIYAPVYVWTIAMPWLFYRIHAHMTSLQVFFGPTEAFGALRVAGTGAFSPMGARVSRVEEACG